jgi:hypothetical protein
LEKALRERYHIVEQFKAHRLPCFDVTALLIFSST